MTDFRIRVIVDPGPAVAGTKKVEGQLKRTSGAADRLRANLLRTFAGIGLTVGIAGSIKLLADYSQAMSTVQAVTGATAEQFDLLNDRAQDLGRNTRFTATQAAEGMVLLARAGFTAEESLTAVEGTLKLAQAGGLGLSEAANIAANSLRGFRLDVEETGRVVDVLALAANSANTNVGQLGEGLKFVAPIAAGLGISLETTTAAIGKLSDSGLQATLAGTGLRRVLSELESPSQKTAQILDDLNLSTDAVRVSQVGLVDALQALKDAGLDTGQALEIFGDRGGPAFEVLSSNIPAVAEMAKRLENAAGTADQVSEVMDDNLNGALLRLKSAFQGLVISAADTQGGFTALEGVANGLAGTLNFLTDNIDGLGTALTIVTAALIAKKLATIQLIAAEGAAAAVTLGNVKFSELLTVAQLRLAGANLTAATSFKALALLPIPPVLLLAGVATASFFAIQKLTEGIKEYEEALKIAEGGELSGLTEFGKLGAQIAKAERGVKAYDERLKAGNITQAQYDVVAGNLISKIDRLREMQDKVAASTDKARAAAQAAAEANEKLNAGYERTIASLEEERRLLGLSNAERRVQEELAKAVAAIQEEGGPELIGLQLEELEAQIKKTQALRDEAKAIEDIRGPQEEFINQLTLLKRLQDEGKISADEYTGAVRDLAEANSDIDLSSLELPEGAGDIDLTGQLAQIQELVKAEQERAEAEALRQSVLRDARGPEEELLERQRILKQLLDEGAITNDQYAESYKRINEQLNPLTEQEKLLAEVLESIKGPQIEQEQRIMALTTLLDQGKISLEEYNAEMDKLKEKSDEVGTSFGDGISSGLEKVGKQMNDIASLSEAVLVNAFNSAEDALVEFATTGKFSFKDFASAIIKDIARVIARLLILQAVQAVTGTGPSGGGGAVGKASGGDFEANQSMIVGEKGPELVNFGQGGTVVPADQTRQALAATGGGGGGAPTVNVAPAEVKVQVVNVDSPEAARDSMDTTEGGKVILNQVRSNRAAFKRELGIR